MPWRLYVLEKLNFDFWSSLSTDKTDNLYDAHMWIQGVLEFGITDTSLRNQKGDQLCVKSFPTTHMVLSTTIMIIGR